MKRDQKYAYAAVVGAILLWASTGGIFSNCRGIFYNPVSTTLGCSLSQLNLAGILSGVASAATMPLFCRWYHRPRGKGFLCLLAVLFCISQYLLGYTTSLAWFYAVSLVQGVTAGFINMYVIQSVASSWFPYKKGTVLGIIALSPSLTGIVMNPTITHWIEVYGWQQAYRSTGITVFVLVGITLVILRQEPAAAGCKPITGSAPPTAAAADPTHSTMLHVLLAAVCVSIIAILNALAQHLANYAIVAGESAAFGAKLVSCTMLGSTIGKFIMGPSNDKIGARTTTLIVSLLVVCASGCLIFARSTTVMVVCAVFMGLPMALSALQIPLICRNSMTPKMYRKYFPMISSLNILLSYCSAGVLSWLYEINYTYTPVLIFTMGALLLCCGCILALSVMHRDQEGLSV